uniref:S100/CaBP-9k-type calcium binding subdomain domain-containing protein n=1 Tax=Equus asinus asinus TaxID=83772 RepID=A0A8C4L7B1_EQUAS
MPELLSIVSIIDLFHSYSKNDGDCQRLNKRELKKLLQQEFGNALEVRKTITLLAQLLCYLGLTWTPALTSPSLLPITSNSNHQVLLILTSK